MKATARMHIYKLAGTGLAFLGALAASISLLQAPAFAVVTAPNTVISNTATATYTDSNGVALATTSNTVTTTVQNAPTMTISSPAAQNVSVDEIVLTNTYTATNTGNAAGNFTIPSDATFTGPGTLVGYAAAGTSCTVSAPCVLSAAQTALAGLGTTAMAGTLALQVEYTVNAGAAASATIAVNFTVQIVYPTVGAAAATTSAGMLGTETDTVLADTRLDVQSSATQPSGVTPIVWTITANNGGGYVAHDLASVKKWFTGATGATGIAIFDKVPTFGGVPLAVSATSVTLGTVTSGATATIYYSTAATPATSSDWTTGSVITTAKWVAVTVTGGTGNIELPSAPSGSTAGAGAVTTAQITLTITTAQPSGTGSGNTSSVTNMANSVVGGNPGATGVTPANGQGMAIGTPDTSVLSLNGIETNVTSSSGILYPGGASNSFGSQASGSYSVLNGPLSNVGVTGSAPGGTLLGSAAATTNLDFTAVSYVCLNGASINNGSTLCTAPTLGVSVPNTFQNTGNSTDTFNITVTPPTGFTAQIFSASSCPAPTTTVPACTGLTAISVLGTVSTAITTTSAVSVVSQATYNYVVVYSSPSGVTPFVGYDFPVAVAGVTGGGTGADTNNTHNDLYPGGVMQITKAFSILSTGCPAGESPSAPANTVCPGGVIQYVDTYADIVPAAMTTHIGTEPAFAYAATSTSAGTFVITDDGTAASNSWATYTFGLNTSAPVDTTSNTTYVYTGSGFSTGTYPANTAGYTKFVATVGGATFQCTPGLSHTITYNVTVK